MAPGPSTVSLPSLLHTWYPEVVLVEPEPNSHAAWNSEQGSTLGLVAPPPPRSWGHCPRYKRVERTPHLKGQRWKGEGQKGQFVGLLWKGRRFPGMKNTPHSFTDKPSVTHY